MPHQQGHLEEEPGYNWSIDESDKDSNWNLSNAVEVAAPGEETSKHPHWLTF